MYSLHFVLHLCRMVLLGRISLRNRRLEVMGAGKNGARERGTRVSVACSVLSCSHYFQAPATQATREFVQTSGNFIFGVRFIHSDDLSV